MRMSQGYAVQLAVADAAGDVLGAFDDHRVVRSHRYVSLA
jgi:hypothetical protein